MYLSICIYFLLPTGRALFPPGTPRASLQPRGPGLEREAVSWFRYVYPLTQQPEWPTVRPMNIIQVCFACQKITAFNCNSVRWRDFAWRYKYEEAYTG